MNPEFLRYFNQELEHLRQVGSEFAHEFPKIAGRLSLPKDSREYCADPYVERLLEGFAFMAARVQHKLEAEFPRFTEGLLETIFPDFLAPLPSTTVVQIEPNLTEVDPQKGFQLPRLTNLRSRISEAATTPCIFRTAHNVNIWPIQLVEAEFHLRDLPALHLPENVPAHAALRLSFETAPGVNVAELGLDSLVFFNRGSEELPGIIYETLLTHTAAVCMRGSDHYATAQLLPDAHITPVGFEEDEAMFPPTARGFEGYRLLREYFTLPERLLFWEISGLSRLIPQLQGNRFDLIFAFEQSDLRLEEQIDASAFGLYCTPVINLFEKNCDRVPMTGRFNEYQLIADRTRPLEFEIYSILEASAINVEGDMETPLSPFYQFRDQDNRFPAYYSMHRRERQKTARERQFVTGRSYLGTEVFLSISDPSAPPFDEEYDQIACRALCTNRHLPNIFPRSRSGTDFFADSGGPILGINCLLKPTQPQLPPQGGTLNWQFINHLSSNFFSFLNFEPKEAAAFIQRILLLYVTPGDLQAKKEISGLERVETRPVVKRIPTSQYPTMARGMEIHLHLQERIFAGSNCFLFASVIERFLARSASLNSFIETVLETDERGRVWHWPMRSGTRTLI